MSIVVKHLNSVISFLPVFAMDLTGKVAVVYSGARGIGKAYCEALIQKGCKVYCGDILVKEGSEAATEIQSKYPGSTVVFKKCDVLIEGDIKGLFHEAIKECGKVDIVIANTGIVDERNWQRCLDINLGSIMRVFYVAMEHMSATNGGKGGDFIATASVNGLMECPLMPAYAATKHGIVGFIRSWGDKDNYKLTKMRCNCICPAAVDTQILHTLNPEQFLLDEQGREWESIKGTSIDISMKPEEIGQGLIKLLEDESAKGQCLIVKREGVSYATFQEI